MRSDVPFGGVVTPGYKVQPAGEAVITSYKNAVADGDESAVSTGHKNAAAGSDESAVSTGHKNVAAGSDESAVSTGHKNVAAGSDESAVSTGHKNAVAGGDESAVSGGHKNAAAGSDESAVSGGHKNAAAGSDESAVSTGHKNATADSVSGRYKTDAAAMAASAKFIDACAGAAWMLFAVTARDGMAWTVAGRGTFAVTGCFLLLPFGMRCAGCADVVMNSFFACRDDFIFSQFVISFLPLKEPLRVRGDFSLLEVL